MPDEHGSEVETLKARINAAFATDADPPAMSLRAGNALDDRTPLPPWDAALDAPDAAYLERNFWGLPYLDAKSWRHYLAILICYALDQFDNGACVASNAINALLASLRPPDHAPPRLASLSPEQEVAVSQFLDLLAFDPRSLWKDEAMIALEEYWAPGAAYR